MTATSRPTREKATSFSCSPFAVFGAGLIIAQLVIFNIGTNFFHNDEGSHPPHQARPPVHALQRRSREKTPLPTRKRVVSDPHADGTFNGYPMYLREKTDVHTSPHCVGENYQQRLGWMHRSCRFNFMCFDITTKDFVVYQTPQEEKMYSHLEERPFIDISQSYLKQAHNKSNTVSLGGINLKWTMKKDGVPRLEWFPEVRSLGPGASLSFYELSPNVVLVPFHSMNGANPGHLVWDDFLPIFTLLTMFQLESESDLLMMRYVLKDESRGLWASCDWKDEKREDCEKMHAKFLPLMMGQDPIHRLTTTEDFSFQPKEPGKSNLICASNGIAGLGALTDHGPNKMHGWEAADYRMTHNHGRGGMLYEFRNYMLSNMGTPLTYEHRAPFRIVFSEQSSNVEARKIDFTRQIDLLRKGFNPRYVSVESYIFKDLSMMEQLEVASETTIFVTGCGGGAVTATFLPKGASVLLYYIEDGGVENNKVTGAPARLDWDLFNNLAYLKVHWMPKKTKDTEADLRTFGLLVQHELDAHIREKNLDAVFA